MADTKISALGAVVAPQATDQYATNSSGVSRHTTYSQIRTQINTAPIWAAGTATAGSWPVLVAGTLLTAPVAGTFELDSTNFYLTSENGNRGIIPVRQLIRADTTRTFTSNTSSQALFTSPAGGALTLGAGTYMFKALLALTGMSATSGNLLFNLLGAGTGVLGSILYQAVGIDAASAGVGAAMGGTWSVVSSSAASLVPASTGTAMSVVIEGTFEVTTAGTVIPSMTLATASAAVLSVGSYMTFERVGSTSVASVGAWA